VNLTRHILLTVLAGAALAAPAALAATAAGDVDGVWANGEVHNLLVTGPAPTGAHAVPLYVIAPVSPSHPLHPLADARTHGFGAHDHVIALAHRAAGYRGACDLTLVVPGPNPKLGETVEMRPTVTPAGRKPLLYAARLGGSLVPLTSASRIQRAHEQGLATLVDTHTNLACTVTGR
jgi:hypothetical protein